jgi:hypothetical protein
MVSSAIYSLATVLADQYISTNYHSCYMDINMKLWDIFQNQDGSLSSRRVFGVILIAAGLIGWYLKLSDTVASLVCGFGAILLGITTADPRPPA